MRLSVPIVKRSIWFEYRAIAETGEPGEATPPETWNQFPQPLRAFHHVDIIFPSDAVVNRSSWSGNLEITLTVELGRHAKFPIGNQLCQPLRSSHHAL